MSEQTIFSGGKVMSDLQIFKNEKLGLQIRCILNEDGSISMNAEDTAKGFGWVDKSKFATSGETYVRWARMNGFLKEFGFRQQVGENDYIPESLFYMLGMKASNEVAKEFQKWLAVDVIPTLRRTGSYSMHKKSPAEMLLAQAQFMVELEQKQNEMQQDIEKVNQRVDGIREVVALNVLSWREDAKNLIVKIAQAWGGNDYIAQVNQTIYAELNQRMGVNLKQRRTNKRRKMAEEGVSKTRQEKVTYVDVIADDKKLIEGYLAIVKEMAIKYGVADMDVSSNMAKEREQKKQNVLPMADRDETFLRLV